MFTSLNPLKTEGHETVNFNKPEQTLIMKKKRETHETENVPFASVFLRRDFSSPIKSMHMAPV